MVTRTPVSTISDPSRFYFWHGSDCQYLACVGLLRFRFLLLLSLLHPCRLFFLGRCCFVCCGVNEQSLFFSSSCCYSWFLPGIYAGGVQYCCPSSLLLLHSFFITSQYCSHSSFASCFNGCLFCILFLSSLDFVLFVFSESVPVWFLCLCRCRWCYWLFVRSLVPVLGVYFCRCFDIQCFCAYYCFLVIVFRCRNFCIGKSCCFVPFCTAVLLTSSNVILVLCCLCFAQKKIVQKMRYLILVGITCCGVF